MSKINCTIDEPFFSCLISGEKTVEGRVRKGKWDNLNIGDILFASCGLDGTVVEFEVIDLIPASSFNELYFLCKDKLIPWLPPTAWEVYSKYFTKEDEVAYGVIGICVKRKDYY